MRTFLQRFSTQNNIPYLDLQTLLLAESDAPIMGSEMLVDHIHPSIRGHQLIAESLSRLLCSQYLGQPVVSEWELLRAEAYETQLNSLDELYYTHGQIRLENLNAWAAGRADGPPIEMHVPIDLR